MLRDLQVVMDYFSPERQVRIHQRGSYGDIFLHRAIMLVLAIVAFWTSIVWYLLPCFLIGMWLVRQGVFHDPAAHGPFLRKLVLWGLVAALPPDLLGVAACTWRPDGLTVGMLSYVGAFPQALAYLGLMTLWSLSPGAAWLRARLQAVGRVALSNYLSQSVICTTIFYSYGFGFFGQLGPAQSVLIIAAVWLIQLSLSTLWLRRFEMGPVEWAWRSLADGRRRPLMRLQPAGGPRSGGIHGA
jgi:uncharacterized protein